MMSMTAGATTAVPRKTRLARSGTAALQHSRLGAVAYGRIYPVHVWPVLRCPPRLLHTHESLVAMLRERLAAHPGTLRDAYDFLAFMGRPLYQVRADVLIPVHLGYLAAKFSGGIYWTVFDHLRDAEARLQFSSFFGRVFEMYVRRSIQRSIPDRGELARRVYPEFVYRTRDGD